MWHMRNASRYILLHIRSADCNGKGPVAYNMALKVPDGLGSRRVITVVLENGLFWTVMVEHAIRSTRTIHATTCRNKKHVTLIAIDSKQASQTTSV